MDPALKVSPQDEAPRCEGAGQLELVLRWNLDLPVWWTLGWVGPVMGPVPKVSS